MNSDQTAPPKERIFRRLTWLGSVKQGVGVLIFVVVLYATLRPENFGVTPNGLDPLFYTGYTINFDDILNAAGTDRYFISRWSAYLPVYALSRLAGPFMGRLLFRLFLAMAIARSVKLLGKARGWTTSQNLLAIALLLTMPMFVRAFFTDYVEYFVVSVGVCLVALCVRGRRSWVTDVAVGGSAGLMIVANPVAVTAVFIPLLAYTLIGIVGVRRRFVSSLLVTISIAVVILSGLILFRFRYGIENVYEPTITFIKNHHGRDPLKSSKLAWLGLFTWLYAPAMLIAVAMIGVARARGRNFRHEAVALAICTFQYLYQWADQFVRDGDGLEIPYYWSFMYPSFGIALILVVSRLNEAWRPRCHLAVGILWVAALLVGVPSALRLPQGLPLALVGLAILVLATHWRDRPTLSAAFLLSSILWSQIGAPAYRPDAYFVYDMNPRYDRLFRQAGNASEKLHAETVWFTQQMDRVADDASTSFLPTDGLPSVMSAVYGAQVDGKMLWLGTDNLSLPAKSLNEIRMGFRPIVAVYGPPDRVKAVVASLPADLSSAPILLDEVHSSALGFQLLVMSMPRQPLLPITWPASELSYRAGALRVDDSVSATAAEPADVLTYGPYIQLPPGKYLAKVSYSSVSGGNSLDVFSSGLGVVAVRSLPDFGASRGVAELGFEVTRSGYLWEIRTLRSSGSDLTVYSLTVTTNSRPRQDHP